MIAHLYCRNRQSASALAPGTAINEALYDIRIAHLPRRKFPTLNSHSLYSQNLRGLYHPHIVISLETW